MLDCTKCGTRNTLDSRFCRLCGEAFSVDAVASAKAEMDQLVADGRKLLNDGRISEAILLAQTALETDAAEPGALALLGDCYERSGEPKRALEYFERAVAADPNAALEKIKIDHLRRSLASDSSLADTQSAPTWRAWGAAIAATLLVASIGAVIAVNTRDAQAKTKQPSTSSESTMPAVGPFPATTSGPLDTAVGVQPEGEADPATDETKAATDEAKPKTQEQPKVAKPKPQKQPAPRDEPQGMNPDRPSEPRDVGQVASNTPKVPRVSTPDPSGFVPVNLGNPRISIIRNDAQKEPEKQPEKQPDKAQPTKGNPKDADPAPKKQDPKPFNPGMIDIRPSKDNARTVGGSEVIKDTGNTNIRPSANQPKDPNAGITGAKALMKVAQQHMLTRNFAAAADAYEKALKAGASPLTVYQRLGQCYQELGRRADAINAYSKAIRAMESAAAGNPARAEQLQVSIDACKKAIRVLGG